MILLPIFPSIHSTVAPSYAWARFVTRLYTSLLQFWIVVYRIFASFRATNSTTAQCKDSDE